MAQKFVLIFFFCILNQLHLVSQSEFTFGLIGKLEFNKFNTINDNVLNTQMSSSPQIAFGFNSSKSISKRIFLDASVLLSRAKYNLNYNQDYSQMINADIRFTQINLNLNYIINPRSEKIKLYLFAGVQNLYRRWGEENYINSILANSYWPNNRIQTQFGIGARMYSLNSNLFIQPFAGLRFNGNQQIIYDTPNNQFFTGVVIGIKHTKNKKNNYNKCPTEF